MQIDNSHKLEMEVFLTTHQIDIMLISETYFTNRSYFKIKGYNTITANHPSDNADIKTALNNLISALHETVRICTPITNVATTVTMLNLSREIRDLILEKSRTRQGQGTENPSTRHLNHIN